MGLYVSLASQPWNAETVPLRVVYAVGILIFLFGIVAGMTLLETDQVGMALSAVYQAMQVPVLSSAVLTYDFVAPLQLGIGLSSKGDVGLLISHGAKLTAYVLTGGDLSVATGVNLWAFIWFVYLFRQLWKTKKVEAAGSHNPKEAFL